MNRRTLIVAAATATTSIAGCLDDGNASPSSPDRTEDPTETSEPPAESPTPSSTEPENDTRLVERSVDVTGVECGSDYGDYDVTTADGVVTVQGTLGGSNGCYTAELVTADYDDDADELSVVVESVEDRGDGQACMECIVEVDYVAEFTFENGEPSNVSVDQRGAFDG